MQLDHTKKQLKNKIKRKLFIPKKIKMDWVSSILKSIQNIATDFHNDDIIKEH